jgi:tetratricopeptide (TPR) repeat protein
MRPLAYASLIIGWALAAPAASGQAIPLLSRNIKEIEALARSDSNDAETQYYLALAYWKKHRWQQADSLLRLTVQLDPRFAEGYLALYYLPYSRRPSLSREEERDHIPDDWKKPVEEAHRFYQLAFRTNPLVSLRIITVAFEIEEPRFTDYTSEEYRFYQRYFAWLFDLGLGRYRSAHERLTTLARREWDEAKHPDKVPDYILWNRGLAAAHSLQLPSAIADFRTLLDRARKQEQKDEVVHVPLRVNEYRFMLAALHHAASHSDSAIALYQEALENDLGLVMAHAYLAGIYDATNRPEDALAERRRAAEAGIDDAVAQFDYGAALFNLQRSAEAEEPARRAMALNPRYAPSYYLLGRIAEELGRAADAREQYTRFLTVAPGRLANYQADASTRLAALK